jgi:capsular polysaccharide biosynthesis protein
VSAAPTPEALEDVFVNPEAMVFRRGRIYPESFALPQYAEEFRRPVVYARFLMKNHGLRRGGVRVPSALWVIDNRSNNYFHWLVESLPRLLRAESWYPDERVLLLPEEYRRSPFVEFTLQAFPQVREIKWIEWRSKARVSRLAYVPRLPRQPPMRLPDDAEIAAVRARIDGLVRDDERPAANRIYFSRGDVTSDRRRVRNERELEEMLREHGFAIVRHDPARPWQQIQLSRHADLVVGLHGAALTNVMFMRRGAQLLELHHPGPHWDIYERLAGMFGVTYSELECEAAEEGDPQFADVCVDVGRIRERLGS